jgi:hypothetical protein
MFTGDQSTIGDSVSQPHKMALAKAVIANKVLFIIDILIK